jgi:hypothetical protein
MKLLELKEQPSKKLYLLRKIAKATGQKVRLPQGEAPATIDAMIDAAVEALKNDEEFYRDRHPFHGFKLQTRHVFANHVYTLLKTALNMTESPDHAARFIVDIGIKGLGLKRPNDDLEN